MSLLDTGILSIEFLLACGMASYKLALELSHTKVKPLTVCSLSLACHCALASWVVWVGGWLWVGFLCSDCLKPLPPSSAVLSMALHCFDIAEWE